MFVKKSPARRRSEDARGCHRQQTSSPSGVRGVWSIMENLPSPSSPGSSLLEGELTRGTPVPISSLVTSRKPHFAKGFRPQAPAVEVCQGRTRDCLLWRCCFCWGVAKPFYDIPISPFPAAYDLDLSYTFFDFLKDDTII